MLQAVAHDVKNKLAELALRLFDTDIEAAALALDSADKLSQALLLDGPEQLVTHIDAAAPTDLIAEVAAVNTQLFRSKTITIDTAAAPVLWYYDVSLMRLAIANVVHNALKHCSQGVVLRAYQASDCLVFEIRDDGVGFNSSTLNTNWSELTNTAATAQHSGIYNTGLGLMLAHRIVAAHTLEKDGTKRSGVVTLSNENGAVVRIALP